MKYTINLLTILAFTLNSVLAFGAILPSDKAELGVQKNYIINGGAERGTAGFATYKGTAGIQPVNGTGGSPTHITMSSSAVSPLKDFRSLRIINSGSTTAQGEGVSYNFTIDTADQAQMVNISFDYSLVSGTFQSGNQNGATITDSDLEVYVYDVTNGVVIQPAGYWLPCGSTVGTHCNAPNITFQTASNSTSYRLIFQVATTNTAAWTMAVDNIVASRTMKAAGPAMTEWVAYTPTIVGFGTVGTPIFHSRRVGDSLEVIGQFTSGTSTATTATVTLGYNGVNGNVFFDTNKVSTNELVGHAAVSTGSTTFFGVDVVTGNSGSQNYVNFGTQTSTTGVFGGYATGSAIENSGQQVHMNFHLPITGWSSNTNMSSETDTRVVTAQMLNSSATAVTANAVITGFTGVYDTHNALASNTFTVPVAGYYTVTINGANRASGTGNTVALYKNGSINQSLFSFNGASASNNGMSGSTQIQAKAGDVLDIRCDGSITMTPSFVTFTRVSGPAVVSATESVSMRAVNTSGQSVPNASATAITTWTKDFDSHGTFNASTGVYTVPVSGKYQVSAVLNFVLPASTAVAALATQIYRNGSFHTSGANMATNVTWAGGSSDAGSTASGLLNCLAGDTISITGVQSTNGARLLDTVSGLNSFSVERVGN